MGQVPNDNECFLADFVLELRIEGDSCNFVRVSRALVFARSASEAYERAVELREESEFQYENPEGKRVEVVFRGLHELCVVHDKPKPLATLVCTQDMGVLTEDQIISLVRPADQLGVFHDRERVIKSNREPKEIEDQLVQQIDEVALRDQLERGDRP